MPQFTSREHFIPRFLLANFTNSLGFLCGLNVRCANKSFLRQPANICYEKDFYEIKNADKSRSYYKRNCIEQDFAEKEGAIAPIFRRLLEHLELEVTLDYTDISCAYWMIALQLIRTPRLKKTIYKRAEHGSQNEVLSNAMYLVTVGKKDAANEYLQANGIQLSDKQYNIALNKEALEAEVLRMLRERCALSVGRAEGDTMFILSDEPVIIDPDERTKYIFPISPRYALFVLWLNSPHRRMMIYAGDCECKVVSRERVEEVNLLSIQNAERFVFCSPEYQKTVLRLIATVQNEGKNELGIQ